MTCLKCISTRLKKGQVFSWQDQGSSFTTVYSVEKGYALAVQHRAEIITLDQVELSEVVPYNDIDPEHMSHIGGFTARPGLIGTVPTGNHILIDGSHRAAYCWRYEMPFSAYLLNATLTSQTIIGLIVGPVSSENEDSLGRQIQDSSQGTHGSRAR